MKLKVFRILGIVLTALLVLALIAAGYFSWHHDQIKFHDLTVELGTESVTLDQFTTEFADLSKVSFVSDLSQVDLSKTGAYDLTLRHGNQQQTIRLTIQDTTAPKVIFDERLEVTTAHQLKPEDFVVDVQDFSPTEVFFLQEPVMNGYDDVNVTVVVRDSAGNQTQQNCTLVYAWLKDSITLEYGNTLTVQDVLFSPELSQELVDQQKLDEINASKPGTYTISSVSGEKTQTCTITVQDTTAPTMKLKEVVTAPGAKKNMDAFLESVTDASEGTKVRFVTEPDFSTLGHYTVTIEAEDAYGNKSTADTLLVVTNDLTGPLISGAETAISIKKGDSLDLLAGVTATDKVDGACEVTVDTSQFDMTLGGTQYVYYKAMDKSHNVTTVKRTINIAHDAEDTKRMVKQIADTLSDDLVEMCMYVNKKVRYTHNWGGDDPVWYGFTYRNGNCYVQAVCLQALYEAKGIECQLAWVTNKTHYWVIVKTPEGKWRHIDATPGDMHLSMGLMTDKQRQMTLSGGRTWDKTKWPACD